MSILNRFWVKPRVNGNLEMSAFLDENEFEEFCNLIGNTEIKHNRKQYWKIRLYGKNAEDFISLFETIKPSIEKALKMSKELKELNEMRK